MILNVYISNSPNLFMTRELVVLLQKNGRAIKNAQREMNIAFEWFWITLKKNLCCAWDQIWRGIFIIDTTTRVLNSITNQYNFDDKNLLKRVHRTVFFFKECH